jgi:hypothetical protein
MPFIPNLGALDSRNWADGSSRVWGAAWDREVARDPRLQRAHWIVDLTLGAAQVRVATGAVRLAESAGASRAYHAGLAVDLEVDEQYEPGSAAGKRSIALAIPNRLVDALGQVTRGFLLAGRAEVSLAIDGGAYEDRLVIMDGDVTGGVSFGTAEGSLVRFSVSDPKGTAGLPLTPDIIDARRFTAASTGTIGQRFPYLFNEANGIAAHLVLYGTGNAQALACVPANGLEVTGVRVNGVEYSAGHAAYGWASEVMLDERGGAYLGPHFSGTHVWTGSESVVVDVGGGADTYLHQCIRGLLEGYTTLGRRRIHYDLLGEVVGKLGSVATRFYVNGSGAGTSATAVSAIEGALLVAFPMVSMVTTDGRYGPVVTDARGATRADLTLGVHLLGRESEVTESDKDDLHNGFTLLYNYNFETDAYDSVATRSPDTSVLCSRSAEVIGVRYEDPVESTEIQNDDVAGYVLDWLVFHRSMPSYYVEYAIPLAYLLRLRLGWNIALTDAQLGWSGVTATIVRRKIRRGLGVIGFRIYWPNLAGVGSGGSASGSPGGPGSGGQ